MPRKRPSDDVRFARIVTTDEAAQATGFFWCGGFSWTSRDYRCVLMVIPSPPRKRSHGAAVEVRGETPEELARAIEARDLVPPSIDDIRAWCESARSSPSKPAPGKEPRK